MARAGMAESNDTPWDFEPQPPSRLDTEIVCIVFALCAGLVAVGACCAIARELRERRQLRQQCAALRRSAAAGGETRRR